MRHNFFVLAFFSIIYYFLNFLLPLIHIFLKKGMERVERTLLDNCLYLTG